MIYKWEINLILICIFATNPTMQRLGFTELVGVYPSQIVGG